MSNQNLGLETQAIRTQLERTQYLEHSVPLYLTSSFIFEDAEDMRASFAEEKERNIYSRFSSPCFCHYEQSGQGEHSVKSYKGIKRTHYNESFVFKAFVGFY
jgi:cystathionine beta-lyase/cystathionine gamma-synthase